MKLIHWVEAHIGRSRRKTKKERGKDDGAPGEEDSQEESTPVREPAAVVIRDPPFKPTPRGVPRKSPMDIPNPAKDGAVRKVPSIRTSFLESTSVVAGGGGGSETLSPRQRSLIRTNPWLPSPRSSCDSSADSGLACARSSSSSSSDSSDIHGSGSVFDGLGFQRQDWSSLCSLRTSRDFGAFAACRNWNPRSIASLGRAENQQRAPLYVRDTCSLPRGEWLETSAKGDFNDPASESSDSDEAFSEASSELEHSVARMRLSGDSGDLGSLDQDKTSVSSPQADSAFVSDASCTASPLSETASTQESLQNKVQRLRTERSIVEEKMLEAREEDRVRMEDRLHLQSELMKHRRALLLHTLRHLREELELQGRRLQVACSTTREVRSQCRKAASDSPTEM